MMKARARTRTHPASEREPRADAESVKLTVRLPANLVKRARHHAVDADLTLQDVLTQALAWFLAQRPRPKRSATRP